MEVLHLSDAKFQLEFSFLVERLDRTYKFTLSKLCNPFKKLQIMKNGTVDFVGTNACDDNIFTLSSDESYCAGTMFTLHTVKPRKQQKQSPDEDSAYAKIAFIGVDAFGILKVGYCRPTLDSDDSISYRFHVSFSSASIVPLSKQQIVPPNSYVLELWQYRRFVHEGYLHLHSIIESDKIAALHKLLHRSLGVPGTIIPGGVQGSEIGKFEGGLANSREVTGLLDGKLRAVVEALLGEDGFDRSSLGTQIAFRFPESPAEGTSPSSETCLRLAPLDLSYLLRSYSDCLIAILSSNAYNVVGWHTDGLRQGRAHPFRFACRD